MKLTVILCTHNRCHSLAKALESLSSQKVPESIAWEVLVVDNNSNDKTRDVVYDFCHRYPSRFRYIFEPQRGKSYALNLGIRESQGDILAFIDDDAVAGPAWLHSLTASLLHGEWAGAGGRILPSMNSPLPPWLAMAGPYSLGGVFAAYFDFGEKPCELTLPPYGTNMAFRRVMFEKYGGFRTDLGPQPGSHIRNEDTEFGRRLMAAGERLRYEPSAVVHHEVTGNRIQKEYFLNWWFDFGRATILERGRGTDGWLIPRRYFTILRLFARVLAPRTVRWMIVFNPLRRFYYKCKVWQAAGEIWEVHRTWRGL